MEKYRIVKTTRGDGSIDYMPQEYRTKWHPPNQMHSKSFISTEWQDMVSICLRTKKEATDAIKKAATLELYGEIISTEIIEYK